MPSGIDLLRGTMEQTEPTGLNLLTPEAPTYDFEPYEAALPYMEAVGTAESDYGIPKNLLARLIDTESKYNPKAVSPVGAIGIAQIMPNHHPGVDPTDPIASINYAGSYLQKLYKRFGSWEKAIAAYNAGPTNVAKLGMDRLPEETVNYLQKIGVQKPPTASSGLDLLKPEEGPIAPTTKPPAEPATGAVADFYRTNTPPIPFQGLIVPSVTPELSAYLGRHGYGPKPEGGWNEFGEPLDKDGNPYYKPQKATGVVAETLQGLSTVANPFNWYEVAKGVMDFGLSVPAFLTGLIGAAGRGSKELLDQLILGETLNLNDVYNAASKGMQESFEFFEPGKKAMIGEPTQVSQMPAQIAMAPLTAITMGAQKLAGTKTFANYPNIQGAIKFGGDALGLITIGMILHGGSRADFSKDVKKIVDDATQLDQVQKALDESPDTLLKQANQAALDAKKAQLELQAKKLAEDVNGDTVLREQMDAIAEAQAKGKLRPTAYTGLKKRSPAQVRAVMERLPDGQMPEYTFTSNKGNVYMKIGDTWYDENRVPVVNKSIIESAEAKKAAPGEEAPKYVPPERKKEVPYKDVKAEAHEVFDALDMHPERLAGLKRKRKIRVIEHTIAPNESVKIPPTWHDAVFRYTAVKTPAGEIIPGESGSYDTILQPGHVAGAKEGTFPAGHTLYLFDTGGGGTVAETNTLRIYRVEPEKPTKVGPKQIDYFGEGKAEPEPSISDDLAMIKAIEDHFGKKISEISDEEMEDFFVGGEEITDVDTDTGMELPGSTDESAPFYQNKAETEKFKQVFAERPKAVAEDPEVFFQKLVNDVNRWYHGEDVPIEQVRDALRTLASRADEYRGEFLTGRDHFVWKEGVQGASKWASDLRKTPEPLSKPKLNAMIPLSEIPEVIKKVLSYAIDSVRSVELYRNKELFNKTGFWYGRDGKWRYELSDQHAVLSGTRLSEADRPVPLPEVFEHPTLYEAVPEMKNVSIVVDNNLYSGEGGYHPDTKLISISRKLDKSSALHEIQHAINHIVDSKFQGTNVRDARTRAIMTEIVDRLEKLIDYAKTDEVRQQAEMTVEGLRYQLAKGQLNEGVMSHFFNYIGVLDDLEIDPKHKRDLQFPISVDGFRNYELDPGEMESRLVEARMNMTAEQRRNTPPWATLDDMLKMEMYPRSYGRRLYSGVSPEEVVRSAKRVAEYMSEARGMKAFKPKVAARLLKEHFVRAFVDRSGNLRKDLLDKLGEEGYGIVQAMYLARGASSMAANALKQMRKEVYHGLTKVEKKVLDAIILADRMIDIAKYKTPKEFKFPRPIEDFVRYRNAFRLKEINGFEKISAERARILENRAQAYFDWMKKALSDLRDEGLITEQEYQDLSSHNYRRIKLVSEIYDHKYKAKIGGKKRTVYDSGVESLARGRETDLYEPSSEIMALEIMNRTYGRILNNRANKTLLDLARRDKNNPFVRIRETNKDTIPSGWTRLYLFENGQRKSIHVHPDVAKEWITTNPEMTYRLSQTIRYVSGSPILRTFATGINWGFALANVPRDVMHAWFAARVYEDGEWKPIYSSTAPVFAMQMSRDLITTFSDALLRKGRYEKYIEEGGGMEFLVHQGRLFQRGRHLEGPLDAFYNFMGYLGETSEIMTRLAIRERVLRRRANQEGITLEEARANDNIRKEATFAARDYMDFGQGGWASKAADNGIPYLNASIQGTRGLFRAFKDNPARSMYKLAQLGTVVTGLYIAMNKMHPKSTAALKGNVDMQNNLCIPLGDQFGFEDETGQMRYPYIKIPLDPGQKFFKNFFEAATDKWLGNEVDVNAVTDSLKQFSPVGGVSEILPPSVSGVLGYATNKDFWLNEDIWRKTDKPFSYPSSKEEYIPGQTPQSYIDFGKVTGLSPERTRYAVEELVTSGTVWSYLLGKGYDAMFSDLPKEQKEQHLAMVLSKVPVIRRFFGVTNPYSQHAASIDTAKEKSDVDRWVQNRGLDALTDGYLFKENVSKKEINEYMHSFKDFEVYKRLKDRFEFQVKTKDLPNRSFWLRLKGLTTEARAQVYHNRFENASPEERQQLLKEQAVVYGIGGIITQDFRKEVMKLRSSSEVQ